MGLIRTAGAEHVIRRAAVFGDVHFFDAPDLGDEFGGPVNGLWIHKEPFGGHVRIAAGTLDHLIAGCGVGGDGLARGVDVDAEEVEGAGDGLEFFGSEDRRVGAQGVEVIVGVAAFENDGEVLRVLFADTDLGGPDVGGVHDGGHDAVDVFSEADEDGTRGGGAHGLDAESMGEDGVVTGGGEFFAWQLAAGCAAAGAVAVIDEGVELVGGHPVGDAVGELADGVVGVVSEGVAGGAVGPATFVFEGLGEIPVEEGAIGLDAGFVEGVEEALVEVEAFGVGRAGTLREDAGPCDGEAETFDAEALHEGDVFFVTVVEVVGDVGGLALKGFAGSMGEGVPDGGAAAVFVDSAFDLIAGSGCAPEEVLGEAVRGGGRDGG